LNARADENTALVATLAAAIQALSTTESQRSVNAELTETYNLLCRALDRKAAIIQRKQI
jgi:hypothetical protein